MSAFDVGEKKTKGNERVRGLGLLSGSVMRKNVCIKRQQCCVMSTTESTKRQS